MKRIPAIILSFAACGALLSGCVVGNVYKDNRQVELRCKAVMSKNTRASGGFDDTYPIDVPFALWAFSLPRGQGWAENGNSAATFINGEEFEGDSAEQTWYCVDRKCYWPFDRSLTFMACSPFEAGGRYTPTDGIVFDNYNVGARDYDLMYTDPITDKVRENNLIGLSVPFCHALCKVDVNARTALSTPYTVTLKKVVIKNLKHIGSFRSFAQEQWTVQNDVRDFTIYDSTVGTVLQQYGATDLYNASLLLMPHKLDAVMEITVDIATSYYTQTKVLQTSKMTVTWHAGKYYTYTLNISENEVAFEEVKEDDITKN